MFARERTTAGVLEGIRAGRTFISHQPPNLAGPGLFLESDGGAMVGDEVAPGDKAEGARRGRHRVRTCGSSPTGSKPLGEPVLATGPSFEHEFDAPAAPGWVRAELFAPDLAEERSALCDRPRYDLLPQHAGRHGDDLGDVHPRTHTDEEQKRKKR